MQNKKLGDFNKENINFIVKLLEKHDLDARFLLGTLNTDWNETQRQIYAIPNDQLGEIYIVPVRANPLYCMGLSAKTIASDDGITVSTLMTEKGIQLPHDVVPINPKTVVSIQVRGLDWTGTAVTIFVTCVKNNWEDKLARRLNKLKPVTDPTKRAVHWDLIEDATIV